MKLKRHIVSLLFLGALVGCASIEVSHDYDPGADFGSLKTFAWMPMESGAAVRELTVKKIMRAVEGELQKKGLTPDLEKPDFLIGMQVSGRTVYGGSTGVGVSVGIPVGPCHVSVGSGRTRPREKHEGTLVLDFMKPEPRSLIWRGTATGVVNPEASPEEQEDLINRVVTAMLANFPPDRSR